jgi:hypothetical protein
MSTPLLIVATLCYVVTAISLTRTGQYSLALAFGAYALANVGLILATRGHP